jgi:hypothetical protein
MALVSEKFTWVDHQWGVVQDGQATTMMAKSHLRISRDAMPKSFLSTSTIAASRREKFASMDSRDVIDIDVCSVVDILSKYMRTTCTASEIRMDY